jgi:hypothetical protein
MVKTLMIHDVRDWMLKLDLSDFDVITFDDGLYSQYKHYKHFLQFGKPLYFFVSTDIVCPEREQQVKETVDSKTAHDLYFKEGNRKFYMKWSQIKEIYNTEGCHIGGHGHTHKRLRGEPLVWAYQTVKDECENMLNTFKEHNISIDSFGFPYNEDIFGYRPTLKVEGVKDFFGNERIRVEDMYK